MPREQDIIHLFKNIDINDRETLQVILAKNFAEIENRVAIIQTCLKQISQGSIVDVVSKLQQNFADTSAALTTATAALEVADGNIQGFLQNEAPAEGANFGDIWIDIDGHVPLTEEDIYRYEDEAGGSQGTLGWQACPTSAVGKVYLEAYKAQLASAGKITTFYQSEIPVALSVGDLWVDINDYNKMYRAASAGADTIIPGEWEPIRDLGVTRTAATFIISDGSTTNVARNADYIVPEGSTSAQTVINEAINALPTGGGKILLLEGTYVIDGPIVISSNVTLEGQGPNTIIKIVDNCITDDFGVIQNSDIINGNNNISILHLFIHCNRDNNTERYSGIIFTKVTDSTIAYCNIKYSRGRLIDMTFCDNNNILNNLLSHSRSDGMFLDACGYNNITGNTVTNNRRTGIMISDDASPGAESKSNENMINGNIVSYNGFDAHGDGINVQGGDGNCIFNNLSTYNTGSGIYSISRSTSINNNVCKFNGEYGILSTNDKSSLCGNSCIGNSQARNNTYDGIHLSDASYNNVQNNIVRHDNLSNRHKYGINISNSGCNGNIVTNNDLRVSGVTGGLRDAGTGTITTAGNKV